MSSFEKAEAKAVTAPNTSNILVLEAYEGPLTKDLNASAGNETNTKILDFSADNIYQGDSIAKAQEANERAKKTETETRETLKPLADPKTFSKYDRDGDGFLTKDEIEAALKTPVGLDVEKALKLVRDKYPDVMAASNDEWGRETTGVKMEDIKAYPGVEGDKVRYEHARNEHYKSKVEW